MIVIIFLTLIVISIPTLYFINEKYIQKIAYLFTISQMALLALNGKLDIMFSSLISTNINQLFEYSTVYIFHQILFILK